MSIDDVTGGGGGEEFRPHGGGDDYGMAVRPLMAGHDDFLEGATRAEGANELADGGTLNQWVVDRIDHEGGIAGSYFQCGLQRGELAVAPLAIDYDTHGLRDVVTDEIRVGAEHHDGLG